MIESRWFGNESDKIGLHVQQRRQIHGMILGTVALMSHNSS